MEDRQFVVVRVLPYRFDNEQDAQRLVDEYKQAYPYETYRVEEVKDGK